MEYDDKLIEEAVLALLATKGTYFQLRRSRQFHVGFQF